MVHDDANDPSRRTLGPAQRWGVSPGKRVWVIGHNRQARREVERHLKGTVRPPVGPIDIGFITPQSVEEAAYFAGKLRTRLGANGGLWVVCPAEASQPEGGFSGSSEELVAAMADSDFTQVGSAAVSAKYMSTYFQLAKAEEAGGSNDPPYVPKK